MATVVVTGANRGIGLALCRRLAARGDKVIALCRRSREELDGLDVQVFTDIDVTDGPALKAMAVRLMRTPIDMVINNAGVLLEDSLEQLDPSQLLRTFDVNALGPLRVVHALLPRLSNGAKIALITSRMGSIADNTSGSAYGYRMSKAALNIAGVSLAIDLRPRGIAVGIIHPGYVRTDMTGGHGNLTTDESAHKVLACLDRLTLDNSGTFWHCDGSVLPW